MNRYLEKWENEYIKNINIEKIEWINLDSIKLNEFFKNNYLDEEVFEYVYDKKASSLFPTCLGMTYLNLNDPVNSKKYNFFLGVVNNNIGKKTILCATIYIDKYYMFTSQQQPLTYISTMEVNSYFRNMGIYKKMCNELFNYINLEQHVITSKESIMGEKYHAFKILKEIFINNGFQNYILEDNYNINNSELYNFICSKQKVLKKINI